VLPLALRFGLLTQFTAFVSVEQRAIIEAGDPLRSIGIPVALPQGVNQTWLGPQMLPAIRRRPAGTSRSASTSSPSNSTGVRAYAGRAVSAPSIRAGRATVRGSLSKSVIRRTIALQRNRVRGCYERALIVQPDLAGRVEIQFVISQSGAVFGAHVSNTTVNDLGFEQCVVGALRELTFPTVEGGGVVIVTYPFLFRPRQQE
jgi:hypothetical protein